MSSSRCSGRWLPTRKAWRSGDLRLDQEQLPSWQAAPTADRVLATVLFTDIVGSTQQAAALGEQRWRRLLDRPGRLARAEVERFRGPLVQSTGTAAWPPSRRPPGRLVCLGLTAGLGAVGLAIGSAIHPDGIEFRDVDIGGIGVHIAARGLGQAGDHQVVVTRTVRDLVPGTDLAFRPLGRLGSADLPVTGSGSRPRRDGSADPQRPPRLGRAVGSELHPGTGVIPPGPTNLEPSPPPTQPNGL
jgi:class 3 adenylate cyclase